MTTAEYFATGFSVISALIAFAALLVARKSVEVAGESVRAEAQLNQETRDARSVAAITSCNQRYLDWRHDGLSFDDENWCYGMWDLIATEFNFFREGWLPVWMFRFWMNTLGEWYNKYPNAWDSHQRFLADYSGSLTDMEDFFQGIYAIARDNRGNVQARNRKVETYVNDWAGRKKAIVMNTAVRGLAG
jgi:hypothetical protein